MLDCFTYAQFFLSYMQTRARAEYIASVTLSNRIRLVLRLTSKQPDGASGM